MAQFDDPAAADGKVRKVKRAVDEVREVALENIDKALQRGEKIDEMVEQTDELQEQAMSFQSNSRTLRRQLWWNGLKGKLIAGLVVAVFIFVCYVVFCGGLTCKSADGAAPATAAPSHY
jgi:vesicle-associated membrane protein 7